MALRDEILQSPRGTQERIIRETGLSRPTVIDAIKGRACTPATAQEIAQALGCVWRWPELVIAKPRGKRQPINHKE